MAPSLTTHYEVYSAGADTSTLTTTSFSPADKEVIAVKLTTWDTASGMDAPTDSLGALTFTHVATAAPGGFNGWAGMWVATVSGTPGSMTISSAPSTGTATRHSMVVERWSGAQVDATPATNATKSGTGTTATTTLTTVSDNSIVSWCMTDENSRDPAASTYASSATQDGLYDGHVGSNSVQYFAYQTAATAGSQTFGVSNSSSLAWVAIGAEIRTAAVAVTGDVSMSTTTTITATGTDSAPGSASPSTATTITATGVNSAAGAATETTTTTITAGGVNAAAGDVSASTATTITAAGANSAVGAANATTTTTAITAAATVGSAASLSTDTAISADAVVTRAAGAPRTGVTGWDLYSTLALQAHYLDYYRSVPPVACPNCGWPLRSGPAGSVVLYCPHGDFRYPEDWDPETMGGL